MLHHDPAAKTHNRLGFTLSMAIALHTAVILGVGFALNVPKAPSATRMDITLSNYATDKKILDADYVAQTNQEASGSESNKVELTTTEVAPVNSSTINQVQPVIEIPDQQSQAQKLQVVTSSTDRSKQANKPQTETPKEFEVDLNGKQERLQRQVELASLQAKLDEEQQVYARLPRIRRSTSVATKAADDAEYLFHWQQRIEKIGNQYYPDEARQQQLFGNVRLLVVISSNGKLIKVEILQSSGEKILDDAAMKIVRIASPFETFPKHIKQESDILEIVRTWQFQKNRFSYLD